MYFKNGILSNWNSSQLFFFTAIHERPIFPHTEHIEKKKKGKEIFHPGFIKGYSQVNYIFKFCLSLHI